MHIFPIKKRVFFIFIAFFCLFLGKARAFNLGNIAVTLTSGVSETYNDNITYAQFNKISDYITKPWVGFSAAYDNKRTTFFAGGHYYRELYGHYRAFNNNSGDFTAALNSELSKFERISVSDAWSRSYDPRSFEDIFGFTGGRYYSDRNTINLGYARDLSEHFGYSLRYSNIYDSYSRSDIAKSYYNTAGIEAAYNPSSDLAFIFAQDFTIRDFSPGADAWIYTLSAGCQKYLTKQLYFSGVIGADFIDSFSGKKYAEPYVNISLSDDISSRTSARLSFMKRYDTVSYTQDLFNQWQASAGLTHELSQRLKSAWSMFFGQGEYVGTAITNKLFGASAGLTYDINDHWNAGVEYSYSHQTSNTALNGYLKNSVTLNLKAEF